MCKKIDDDTGHLGPFTTVRACRSCGVLISGGPTQCLYCAERQEEAEQRPQALGSNQSADILPGTAGKKELCLALEVTSDASFSEMAFACADQAQVLRLRTAERDDARVKIVELRRQISGSDEMAFERGQRITTLENLLAKNGINWRAEIYRL